MFSILSIVSCFGDGRDDRTCVILEINKLLIIVILPYGVKFLPFQMKINFCISAIFSSTFMSVILSKLSIS